MVQLTMADQEVVIYDLSNSDSLSDLVWTITQISRGAEKQDQKMQDLKMQNQMSE